MSQVKRRGTAHFLGAAFLVLAIAVAGTASLAALRTSVWSSESAASKLDREIDRLNEELRDAERTLTALTAPMGLYAKAEDAFGMQRASLSGVLRLDMPADSSVMSASLPSAGN